MRAQDGWPNQVSSITGRAEQLECALLPFLGVALRDGVGKLLKFVGWRFIGSRLPNSDAAGAIGEPGADRS
jgi:hypothetical protein